MLSKTINKSIFNVNEITKFIHDVRYILLLYIVGDFLTTFHALNSGVGFEENGFLAGLLGEYGFLSLVIVKIMIMGVVFWAYHSINAPGTRASSMLWAISKNGISFLGLVLVINNLMVICVKISLFECMGLL